MWHHPARLALPVIMQATKLGSKIDSLYSSVFVGVELPPPPVRTQGEADHKAASEAESAAALQSQLAEALPDPSRLTEAGFGELGRTAPKVCNTIVVVLLILTVCSSHRAHGAACRALNVNPVKNLMLCSPHRMHMFFLVPVASSALQGGPGWPC